MAILVTGGAGYIGSHVVLELLNRQEEVIVLDNLSTGNKESIKSGKIVVGNLENEEILNSIFKENHIEAVLHFAACSIVSESILNPLKYYQNNVLATLKLLEKMVEYNVKKMVFSSSAAVYGDAIENPIDESCLEKPTNPYGQTKLTVEKVLKWFSRAYSLHYISLRYFNACGADESASIGECHFPETHLIPTVLKSVLNNQKKAEIFGVDYNTPDGTCVRDYVHVTDLAIAHILSLEKLRKDNVSSIYNLGNERGFSVKEIIQSITEVTGENISCEIKARRDGDPAILVANSNKIKEELKWTPKYSNINIIILSAWRWHQSHPNGF